jgi:hypothetical protein
MEKFKSLIVNVSKSVAGDEVDGKMEYDKNVYNLLDELPFCKKMKAHADAESDLGDKMNAE